MNAQCWAYDFRSDPRPILVIPHCCLNDPIRVDVEMLGQILSGVQSKKPDNLFFVNPHEEMRSSCNNSTFKFLLNMSV